MATYKFVKETNGFSFQVDAGQKRSWNNNVAASCYPEKGGTVIQFNIGSPAFEEEIIMAGNTVTIGGVDVTADGAEAICDQLRDSVFPSTNSGSGGSGGGGTVLQSAGNGSKWLLGVNDLGATVTTQTDEGTPTLLYRWSQNGTKWFYGVSDLGAVLTVEESKNYADDAAAAAGGIPVNGLYHTDGFVKIRTV